MNYKFSCHYIPVSLYFVSGFYKYANKFWTISITVTQSGSTILVLSFVLCCCDELEKLVEAVKCYISMTEIPKNNLILL